MDPPPRRPSRSRPRTARETSPLPRIRPSERRIRQIHPLWGAFRSDNTRALRPRGPACRGARAPHPVRRGPCSSPARRGRAAGGAGSRHLSAYASCQRQRSTTPAAASTG
eukprot:797140-Prorocentrum_minimum.AAC.1